MSNQRFYQVDAEGQKSRIIEAPSASAAIRIASNGVYTASVLNARDLAKLVIAGARIETGIVERMNGDATA